MNFIEEFEARGFLHQCTDHSLLSNLTKSKKITAYIGFDCTADSLHVGSLMMIMVLRLLQKHGHQPIAIVGGGTTKIGDPTGRDEARKMLTDQDIQNNKEGIKNVLSKFIRFGDKANDALLIDNDEWLSGLNYLNFLRDYGKHFSINRMLSFDSVKLRLDREQSLSFLEFNYMILQAYDFVELSRRYNCRLQIGGSDQWGNIINGVELSRRLGEEELFGLTTPLITTASGTKMGKSAAGAVWLSDEKLSAYDYYQFWRNTEDLDVIKFMKFFTDLSVEEIYQLEQDNKDNINNLKKILAFEATKICHGADLAKEAEETAIKLFEQGEISGLIPEIFLAKSELSQPMPLFKLFVLANLVSSGGDAKRLIKGKGAKLNNVTIEDETATVSINNFDEKQSLVISAGKKKYARIILN
jgi:tyrosyl-tRNA synthetase